MVILPRPSPFGLKGSSRATTLSAAAAASSSSPSSSTANLDRCTQQPLFRFLNDVDPSSPEFESDSGATAELLKDLLQQTRSLVIPSAFGWAQGQAWKHDPEVYPSLLEWKDVVVPSTLRKIGTLLDDLQNSVGSDPSIVEAEASDDSSAKRNRIASVITIVICVVSCFVSPSTHSFSQHDDGDGTQHLDSDVNQIALDPWSTESSSSLAWSILHQQLLFSDRRQDTAKTSFAPLLPPKPTTIAIDLLSNYIKPLFRGSTASSSSSTDPSTGRRKPPVQGSTLISSLDAGLGTHKVQASGFDDSEDASADDAAWKGSSSPTSAFTVSVPSEVERLQKRYQGLGSANVLSLCIALLRRSIPSTSKAWETVWPLFLPPLLTLLEDSQPRFRLKGACIVRQLLYVQDSPTESDDGDRIEGPPASLLINTGIGALLERALNINLTYVHDQVYGAALLEESIASLRALILRTTNPIRTFPHQSHHGANGETGLDDCGEKRFNALSKLISQAILSTWSYLPLPPSGNVNGRRFTNVTCHWFMVLAHDLVPIRDDDSRSVTANDKEAKEEVREGTGANAGGGISGVKRFLEVSLEWLVGGWMSHVEFLPLHLQRQDILETVRTTTLVVNTIFTLLSLSTLTKGKGLAKETHSVLGLKTVAKQSTRLLVGVSKCWINLTNAFPSTTAPSSPHNPPIEKQTEVDVEAKKLANALKNLVKLLVKMEPNLEPRFRTLAREVEPSIEELLAPSDSSTSLDSLSHTHPHTLK